ncbi:MAG: hypothetical protein ABI687_12740 [Flavitalea sp.]
MKSFSPTHAHACFFIFIFFIQPAPDHNRLIKQTIDQEAVHEHSLSLLPSNNLKQFAPYISNRSHSVIYYKPEDRLSNPGLDPNEAYPIAPGEDLYFPVDGLVTAETKAGEVYRVPTGAKVVVREDGSVEPVNLVAIGGLLLGFNHYGNVKPPASDFARLSRIRMIDYGEAQKTDFTKSK